MSKPIFFGITGVKESGKSTAFEAIKIRYPRANEVMLAKHLKDACSEVLKINRNFFDDQKFKEVLFEKPIYLTTNYIQSLFSFFGFDDVPFYTCIQPHIGYLIRSPRHAAQYVGTEILRNFRSDIHCEAATKYVDATADFNVITDMRFWNEYNYFADSSKIRFFPIYIQNNFAEAKVGDNPHPSEKFIKEIGAKCQIIYNDGISLHKFQTDVVTLIGNCLQEVANEQN